MYRDDFNQIQSNTYWSFPRIASLVLLALLVIYALGFLATGGDLMIYRYWAPKQAAAQREVFENSSSYVQGKISYLALMRLQWETADPAHKAALRTMILTEASSINPALLPTDQQAFINQLKGAF